MHCDITADDFISKLVNDGLSSVPWVDSTFSKDFILLAEFSELEGPKPIFTIPNDAKRSFDLEQFSLRIMSADCVSILQTTDLSTFNIAGDIQVVLTEVSEGAAAFVHHFVLYDIRARGYVRPYCLAYVTRTHTGLMKMFESLLRCFSLVSSLFHFGNALNFINELVSRCEQVKHLDEVLNDESSNICVGDKILSDLQKQSIMKQDIDENLTQLVELRKIFQEYLDKEMYVEHRELFTERYKQVCVKNMQVCSADECPAVIVDDTVDCFSDCNQIIHTEDADFVLCSSCTHEIQSDVIASLLGKRYDKPLRHLGELCDVTYQYGVDFLKAIVKKHCSSRVELTTGIQLVPCSIEQAVEKNLDGYDPLTAGENCCPFLRKRSLSLKLLLDKSINRQKSTHKHDGSNKCNVFDLDNSCFSSSRPITPLEGRLRNNSIKSNVGSFVSVSSTGRFINTSDGSSQEHDSSSVSSRENTTYSGMSRQTSSSESLADYDKISLTSSLVNSSIKDVGNCDLFLKCSKISILKLRHKFSFLSHAVYSILIGRPLVVIGEEKNKNRVRKLVLGLANFIQTWGNSKAVIPWLNGSFTLSHIGCSRIVGMLKNTKGKTISNSLKPYVSILNFEEETLFAPRYVGKFLSDMFNVSTHFLTDVSYRHFVLQLFTEMASKAFIQFVIAYAQPEKEKFPLNVSGNSRVTSQRKEVRGDEAIMLAHIQRMRNKILDKLSDCYCEELGSNKPRVTMKLSTYKCFLFTNSSKKKR